MHARDRLLTATGPVFVCASLLAAADAAAHDPPTVHVANNGVDSPTCGAPQSPCRSISQGIDNSTEGGLIVVGPGRYGDLNGNESIFDEGEEFGGPGCFAVVCVDKRVTIVSRSGASATVIDGAGGVDTVVKLTANGAVFGAPRKGFTLTNTLTVGATIEAQENATFSGNVSRGHGSGGFLVNLGQGHHVIGNVAIDNVDFGFGIRGLGVQVTDNVAVSNGTGFGISNIDTFVTRNFAVDNDFGFSVFGSGHVVQRNAITGNRHYGIRLFEETQPDIRIERNNIYGNNAVPLDGNVNCGVMSTSSAQLSVANNYWGAATGPGPDPADAACDTGGGQLVVTPFSPTEFRVRRRVQDASAAVAADEQ